jgi:hypothetical protein
MIRFTAKEFDTAFREVYPHGTQYKHFLETILTLDPVSVPEFIQTEKDSRGEDQVNVLLQQIIYSNNIEEIMKLISYINRPDTTSNNILQIMAQQEYYRDIPILKMCLKMLQNREQGSTQALHTSTKPSSTIFKKHAITPASTPASARPSALFAHPPRSTIIKPSSAHPSALPSARPSALPSALPSARPSAHPTASAFARHKANLQRSNFKAASVERQLPGMGGGSRRRRTSHGKRKSYRKSKRVRHTPRKQTHRHRHRHRRSRHRR